jgi:hypothetical protein
MQKIFLLIFSSILLVFAGSIDKRLLDLEVPELAKTASLFEYEMISNNCLEATLINGGYFTLGTNAGTMDSPLNDKCAITYGHPFAKTSYPLFSIDGNWYKVDDYFLGSTEATLNKNGDTLSIIAEEDFFMFTFSIFPGDSLHKLQLELSITNIDTLTHYFGTGLVVDPGIGKWGD